MATSGDGAHKQGGEQGRSRPTYRPSLGIPTRAVLANAAAATARNIEVGPPAKTREGGTA